MPPTRLLKTNAIFLLGSFLVRCAGCSWNDIVDQDIDRRVERTAARPLARRAISTSNALLFTIAQVVIGLTLVILLLPFRCLYYSIPSIFGTGLYPYGKRFTHYPQLILGCVFSWGVVMALPALDIDLSSNDRARDAAACLFLSCVAWTMVYDTIYAAQDRKDDVKVGVLSPVVRHQDKTRRVIMGAALMQIALLCLTGVVMKASAVYFLCACLGGSLMLGAMVGSVRLSDPKDCLWWFKSGCLYTGVIIACGFLGEYCLRRFSV